jgi:peptidyl-prolyl cis-trans isomerase SurA
MAEVKLRSFLSLATVAVVSSALPPAARGNVAERVVAVVGEHAILQRHAPARASLPLLQISRRFLRAQQAAAESESTAPLQRMVDERVEQQAAEKAHLTVTTDDRRRYSQRRQSGHHRRTARRGGVKTGLTPQEYRDEVRRQILEGKLLQLRVRGRVRVTEDDIKATYIRLVRDDDRGWLSTRLIVPHACRLVGCGPRRPRDWASAATARVTARGNRVGETLASSFSDDAPTRGLGGDLGEHKPGDLAQPIEDEAQKLDVGGVSTPFRFKNDIVILKLVSRDTSQLPSLEIARDELLQRTYAEQMDKARKQWIEEMRHGTYVDVRL